MALPVTPLTPMSSSCSRPCLLPCCHVLECLVSVLSTQLAVGQGEPACSLFLPRFPPELRNGELWVHPRSGAEWLSLALLPLDAPDLLGSCTPAGCCFQKPATNWMYLSQNYVCRHSSNTSLSRKEDNAINSSSSPQGNCTDPCTSPLHIQPITLPWARGMNASIG